MVAVLQGFGTALAQVPPTADSDPPLRVARTAYLSGEVSFSPSGTDEWVAASINRPVVTGDRLWADQDGRAEFAIDNSVWWMGASTSVTVSNLDDRTAQLELQQGTLDVRLRRLAEGDTVEIDTPNLAFSLTRPGIYRVFVDPQTDSTTVVVRNGQGEVYGEAASYVVTSGQSYRFQGTDLSGSEFLQLPPYDDFDRWVAQRDARYQRGLSDRYVSPEVVGYEDLDRYGTWSVVASYGNVWFPRGVRAGWAPYHDGHWAWIDPWGWTWVDDAPWGFAPFHYGRWAYVDRGWGWIPGPVNVRPVYAPALVAFIGGSGFSISISSGPAIGWFALGPRDVYRPPYNVSRNYFREINVSNTVINTTNITNIYNNTNVTQVNYVNMRAPNAVTAVRPQAFAQSQNVSRVAVALPASAIAAAQVQPLARIAPAARALVGAAPPARNKPPAAVAQRGMVAKTPPPPPPVPVAQRLQMLERTPGKPLTSAEVQSLRQAQPTAASAVRLVNPAKPAPNAAPPAKPAGPVESPAARSRTPIPSSRPAEVPGASRPAGVPAAVPPPGAVERRIPAPATVDRPRDARPVPQQAQRPPEARVVPQQAQRPPEARAVPQPAPRPPEARAVPQPAQRPQEVRAVPQQVQRLPEVRAVPQPAQRPPDVRAVPQQVQRPPEARGVPQQVPPRGPEGRPGATPEPPSKGKPENAKRDEKKENTNP